MRVTRSRTSSRVTLAAVVAALVSVPASAVGSNIRTVDLWNPGSTYGPATVRAVGDGVKRVTMTAPERVGGVLLTAIGTETTKNEGTEPAANARGFMSLFVKIPDPYGCGTEDPLCEETPPPLEDTCSFTDPVGRAPLERPRRKGVWKRVAWTAIGCVHEEYTTTFPIADGVTTYTVSDFKRTKKPAVYRTIWDDANNGDDYFNICLDSENIGSIKQKGGRRYCTVLVSARVDRVSFRVKQQTKITKRYPAYVCTPAACRG